MSAQARRKRDTKAMMLRIVSLTLAGLMIVSVVLATVWRW